MSARTKHLKVLGLDEKADEATIKKAFKKLALLYHPDRNSNNVEEATERFKQINEAHTYLTSGAAPVAAARRTPPEPPEPATPAEPPRRRRPRRAADQRRKPPTPQRPPAEKPPAEADALAEARRKVQEAGDDGERRRGSARRG